MYDFFSFKSNHDLEIAAYNKRTRNPFYRFEATRPMKSHVCTCVCVNARVIPERRQSKIWIERNMNIQPKSGNRGAHKARTERIGAKSWYTASKKKKPWTTRLQ